MRLLRENALEFAQCLHILQVCIGIYERDLRLSALADKYGLVALDCLLRNFGEIRAELLGTVMFCHDRPLSMRFNRHPWRLGGGL